MCVGNPNHSMRDAALDLSGGDMALPVVHQVTHMPEAWIVDGVDHSLLPGGRPVWLREGEGQEQQEAPPAATAKGDEKLKPDGKTRKEDKGYSDPQSAYFSCNICLELAQDPVVTQCGHLYCWPCIYKWLQVFPEAWLQVCPVCKAGLSEELVIPLYGRGTCELDPRQKTTVGSGVPMRPQGLHLPAQNLPTEQEWAGVVEPPLQGPLPISNFGLMNSLFGFGHQFAVGVRTSLLGEPMSPAQQQQAFLSRLLLLLGSFVIMCLLVF